MVQTTAGLAPSLGKGLRVAFLPITSPWVEALARVYSRDPSSCMNGMLCSRLTESTTGSSLEVVAARTYSLLQPDLHLLEDSGTLGSFHADVMGDDFEGLSGGV